MSIKTVALEAVQKAGAILMQNIDAIGMIRLKQANDYLTNIDIQAENTVKAIIKKSFPEHAIIAEESGGEGEGSLYTWFVDPISSTQNYVHGLPHFAVVISVRKGTDFVFSAVFDPFFHELFSAEKGKGAYLNEKKMRVSSVNNLSKALMSLVIQTKGEGNKEKGLYYFGNLLPHVASFRRIGSLALELCYVASGRLDGQVFLGSDIFSLPAGKLILEEAGGKLTDFDGKSWTLDSSSVIATNGMLHSDIVHILRNL
jgi:myo-inositol-1(or 4)-monophosphatase